MEKEKILGGSPHLNWHPSQVPPAAASEMNCGPSDQMSCFLNLNWDQSMEHSVQFDSALSSIVSSPTNPAPLSESVVIRELIGKLGSICNSGEISPQSHQYMSGGNNSTNTSCYSTPLNSPPKLNLSINQSQARTRVVPSPAHLQQFATDPGFAERAARFSCFSGRNYGGVSAQFGLPVPETGKLSRVSSSQSLKAGGSQLGVVSDCKENMLLNGSSQMEMEMRPTPEEDVEFASGRDESSVSDQIAIGGEVGFNARKRKAASRGKAKDFPSSSSSKDLPKMAEEDLTGKRSKSAETGKDEARLKMEQNGDLNAGDGGLKQGKENNSKPPEPPKQDYIHVRARRGQATDSHSLAERVRREKISERMKFLQDLVPGCNKVTGKAVMLDEIINYVQSLQRQVEFLSMKLATVNPRLDINVESLLPKDMHQSRGPFPHSVYPFETCGSAFSFVHQPQQGTPLQSIVTNGLETQCSINPLDSTICRTLSMQLPSMDGFGDAASQLGCHWEDDLHSVVHMGFGQNQETAFSSQDFHGTLPASNMKIEL